MRQCKKCDKTKMPMDFYSSNPTTCKECVKRQVRANYALNRDYYAAYDRKRQDTPERRAAKIGYTQNHRSANAEKNRARQRVSKALLAGTLTKCPCEVCGHATVDAHHEDYSKPLDVRWLCRKHHLEAHGKVPVRSA